MSGDLNLHPLADNGGVTLTHAINSDSAANNAGDPDHCLDRDQRGVERSQEACDAGAFEYVDRLELYLPVMIR